MSVVLEIGDTLRNIIKRPNNIGLNWWQQEVANLHFHGKLQIPSGVSLVLRQILIQFWSFPQKIKISEPYVDSPNLPLYSSLTHPLCKYSLIVNGRTQPFSETLWSLLYSHHPSWKASCRRNKRPAAEYIQHILDPEQRFGNMGVQVLAVYGSNPWKWL